MHRPAALLAVLGLLAPLTHATQGDGSSSLMLWPSSVDAKLSISDANVVTPTAAIMGVLDASLELALEAAPWPAAIASVDIAFVPSVSAPSSTWVEYLAQEQAMPVSSEGIHVRVTPAAASTATSLEIQGNATALLTHLLGTAFAPTTTYRFANASCDLPAYATNASRASIPFCYVASRDVLALPDASTPSFFAATGASPLQRALSSRFPTAIVAAWTHIFTHVIVAPIDRTLAQVVLRQVAETADAISATTRDVRIAIVESIDANGRVSFLELEGQDRNSYVAPRTVSRVSGVEASIVGHGFHQTMAIDMTVAVAPKADETCAVLVVQPLPQTAYADMDELRRLERFGVFELVAFSKHIEIERPAAISTEHVVAFVASLPPTGRFRLEYPVHFRYQSPAKDLLYRPSVVVAPSLYVRCTTDVTASATEWTSVVSPLAQPAVSVEIPVGNLSDGRVVTSVTLFVSIVGCLLLYKSFPSTARSTLKQATSWRPKHD
ncbi:hypothetical protein, variant [Saprolegnia diclina VS20]|uniref:Uncharacterized protein n=1 Tax=Saprolegnia diclina (strain VS20) TaxID=1156394 RepID=T0R5N7_SAPDV|nr:hypothetical protein SDRG_01680 [Saprolegnia diclina VS20]XP_008605439.1 hypothetical protein, variant [Saprolegnia diclina VS20]EQC41724.1 hypothetical protein SDRG_01680 [Saprolegnia diclina VS20]EQC41725.1 hypothetical protein, variant [Saprolegnia diclina VS20]|eukprot:XP_008605438.1 hypothetical protein SDRG_01680 [Saprolegnia diclina VS20]